jgi:hypothetical protein
MESRELSQDNIGAKSEPRVTPLFGPKRTEPNNSTTIAVLLKLLARRIFVSSREQGGRFARAFLRIRNRMLRPPHAILVGTNAPQPGAATGRRPANAVRKRRGGFPCPRDLPTLDLGRRCAFVPNPKVLVPGRIGIDQPRKLASRSSNGFSRRSGVIADSQRSHHRLSLSWRPARAHSRLPQSSRN